MWVCPPSTAAFGNQPSGCASGPVTCMDHCDLTGDGIRELIVGREGGAVQVYAYDDGEERPPTLRYTYVSH